MSYIASEADNFEELDKKFFTLDETANLLASSHHQHRLYALNLLTKMLSKKSDQNLDIIFDTALNPDCSDIVKRLTQVVKVSSAYIDCTRRLCDFINNLMQILFSKSVTKMEQSLVESVEVRGLRLFQVYLSDMI